jgi:hypothetical protein
MPFFNKKPQAADADTTTAVGGSNAPASEKKGLFSRRTQTPAEERAAYGNENSMLDRALASGSKARFSTSSPWSSWVSSGWA